MTCGLRAGGAVPAVCSSARPDVEAVGSSGHPHYVDVGLAAAVSAATYEQQKEPGKTMPVASCSTTCVLHCFFFY